MDTQVTSTTIRDRVAQELRVTHLPTEEQDAVILQMSTMLLDRITLAILSRLPDGEVQRIDALLTANQQEAALALALKSLPDAPQFIETLIADSMSEYNALLDTTPLNIQ